MTELKLILRPADPHDFKVTAPDGTSTYLFGKLYFVKNAAGWSVNLLSRAPLSKTHFSECYKAGLVHVLANGDDMGIIDLKTS